MRLAASLSALCLLAPLLAGTATAAPKRTGRAAATRLVEGLTADAKKAAALWRKACPGRLVQGLCAARRARITPSGLPSTFAPRRPAQAKAALALYARIVKRWDRGRLLRAVPESHPRHQALLLELRERVAEATFVAKEAVLETDLGDAPPRDLDMSPANPDRARADTRRLSEWLKRRLRKGDVLIRGYMTILTDVRVPVGGKNRGSATYSLAAVLRSAQIFHRFAQDIASIPAPVSLRQSPDAVRAFEAEMAKFVGPLEEKARSRYLICLRLQRDLKVDRRDPWASACQAALKTLPPERTP